MGYTDYLKNSLRPLRLYALDNIYVAKHCPSYYDRGQIKRTQVTPTCARPSYIWL